MTQFVQAGEMVGGGVGVKKKGSQKWCGVVWGGGGGCPPTSPRGEKTGKCKKESNTKKRKTDQPT